MGKRCSRRIESGMESSMVAGDWSSVPSDLIESILDKLDFNLVDVLRFGAVCKSWHNITINRPLKALPPQIPWLLLSSLDTKTEIPFSFLNISDNNNYFLPPPPYPTTTSGRYTSTVNGWLFMFENSTTSSSLVNPLTRQQVVLPQIDLPQLWTGLFLSKNRRKFPQQCMKSLMRKVVFSSPPSNKGCLVMAITRARFYPLLFCKVGVTKWNRIIIPERFDALSYEPFQDIIYFKGKFYAVDSYGRILVISFIGSSVFTEQITTKASVKADNTYLVDVLGELVFIARIKEERSKTTSFYLFRQDSITKEWIQIETIRDNAIFLGYNHSVSLLASNYSGCKGNCIYFNSYEPYNSENAEVGDCGIFNLANGLVEPLPWCSNSELTTQFPVWVATSLW